MKERLGRTLRGLLPSMWEARQLARRRFTGTWVDRGIRYGRANARGIAGAAPRELDATDVCRPENVGHVGFTDSAHRQAGQGTRLVVS